jgi:hypothetical protein
LPSLDWAEADVPIVDELMKRWIQIFNNYKGV